MRGKRLYSAFLVAVLVWLASCAPKEAPVPTPAPAAPQVAPAVPTPAAPAPAPEDAAWAKVVQEAKKEGRVNIYTTGLVGDINKAIADAFFKEHGIKLEFITGVGAANLERVKTEQAAKKYTGDIWEGGLTIMLTGRDMGLTARMPEDLPVFGQKGVWRQDPRFDPEGHVLVTAHGFMTVYINTNLVKPGEEPKSFPDLLAPKWKGGKIALTLPVANPFLDYIYHYRNEYGIDDSFFRELVKQEPRIEPTIRDTVYRVASGEAAMIVPAAVPNIVNFVKEGAPVQAIELRGGTIVNPQPCIMMIKNAPHPNATKLFVNWLLSQPGQRLLAKAVAVTPVRNDVPDVAQEVFRFKPQKPLVETYESQVAINRSWRAQTVAKLMGLEK